MSPTPAVIDKLAACICCHDGFSSAKTLMESTDKRGT